MAEKAQLQDSVEAPNDQLTLAKQLVTRLESGANDDAETLIAQLAGFRDSVLFNEIGRLTRELHNAIKEFVVEAQINEIAQNEMPDAAERLRYVITMTEQAANTTLNAVETALPISDTLNQDAKRLAAQWQKFKHRELTVDDFRVLSDDIGQFLQAAEGSSQTLHQLLEEVLMAQGFQDLTGQVIRKVIDLVTDVEVKLVELIRMTGTGAKAETEGESGRKRGRGASMAGGPAVPGVDEGDRVQGQDGVDDLLSSLGF